MRGAGKRTTQPPDRYNPSEPYPGVLLPSSDFDLNMSENESFLNASGGVRPNDELRDMFANLATTLTASFQTALTETKESLTADNSDTRVSVTESLNNLKKDMILLNNECISIVNSGIAGCKQYTDNQIINVKRELQNDISSLSDRVCLVEGQASRLSAVENTVKHLSNLLEATHPNNIQPNVVNHTESIPSLSRHSVIFTSTINPNNPKTNNLPPLIPTIDDQNFSSTNDLPPSVPGTNTQSQNLIKPP